MAWPVVVVVVVAVVVVVVVVGVSAEGGTSRCVSLFAIDKKTLVP